VNGDIELEIGAGSGPGNYVVRVVRAAAGGEPACALELDVEEVLGRRGLLEATVLASAVARRSVSAAEQPVREVGRQLFEALFTGPVYGMYRASLGVAQERGRRLRVVLRLTAPELAALPWEMLFDSETGTYLCRQEPLVRHVPAPYTPDPLGVRPPLRILGLVASPRGLPALDVDAEKGHLAEALASPLAEGLVDVTWVPTATWAGVHAQLLAGEWHVLHFVGHGDYDSATDEGTIALVGADGRADLVEAGRLADLLGEARPAPRLVVLNSCSSGQAGAHDLFSGTAAALVRSGISAVAAMQFAVSDVAAVAFARGFYTAIAHGRNVDEAARSGRISILGQPRSLEWVTPVLYVRGEATQLFTFTAPAVAGPETPTGHKAGPGERSSAPEQSRRRQAELRALYVEARAELRLENFGTAIGLLEDLLILDQDYADAAALRDKARRGQQLADAYAQGVGAEDVGDWLAAARSYNAILQVDPGYRDAAIRKEVCEARRQVADLQAELRHHAEAGHWQAVLDVDAELTRLDPSSSDPDELATQARATLAALASAASLERLYAQARADEESGDWSAGVRGYDEILQSDPAYRDAAARRDWCQERDQVAILQSGLEDQAAAGNWLQVLATFKDLAGLDPAAAAQPSCADLAGRARLELATHPPGPLRRIDSYSPVNAVSWHPGGHSIAVANDSPTVRVYDISGNENKEQLAVVDPDKGSCVDVAFSPDGARLATGSADGSARVWDAASGKQLLEVRHGSQVAAVVFSPDGARLATGSADDSARVWDAASGNQLLEVRHDYVVKAVVFSPDGAWLATGSADDSARVWDAASGNQLLKVRHDGTVWAVAFNPDGTRLATASYDRSARVWDAVTGQKLLEVRHDSAVWAVAFSPDGTRLATAGRDKSARIWPVAGL
jgi:hypothetical protein